MPDIDDQISQYSKKQEEQAKVLDELKSLRLENSRLRDELNGTRARIQELEGKIEGMVDFPTDVIELRAIIGRQRGQIATFEEQLNERDFKATELETELSVFKDRYEKLRARLQGAGGLEVVIKEKDLEINELKMELKSLEERLEKSKVDAKRSVAADYENEIFEKNARIKNLESELQNIKETYDKFKGNVNALRAKYHMDELSEEIAEFDFKEIEANLNLQLKERDDIIKVNEEKIEKLIQRQEKNLKQLEDQTSELVKLRAEKDAFTDKHDDLQRTSSAEIDRLKREAKDNQKMLERQFQHDKEEILKGFEEDQKRIETFTEDYERVQEEIEKAKNETKRYKEVLDGMKKMLETDPNLKIWAIVDDAGPTSLDALAKSIGISVANTRRIAMMLERRGLVIVDGDIVRIS